MSQQLDMGSIRKRLQEILSKAPKGWHGTTYPNDFRYRGRQAFVAEMVKQLKGTEAITKEYLDEWYPEDYVRLGSPFSTLLEIMHGLEKGFKPENVYAFGSRTLPLIAVLMVVQKQNAVVVYAGEEGEDFTFLSEKQRDMLKNYGCSFEHINGEPDPSKHDCNTVVVQICDHARDKVSPRVDAVIDSDRFLYIINESMIPPEDTKHADGSRREGVHTIRKRLGAPPPTPDSLARLEGKPLTKAPCLKSLHQHLKDMAGCGDAAGEVLLSTVGLCSLSSVIMACLEIAKGEIDLLMCSTAYGGSSQQADILHTRSDRLDVRMRKVTFDIQGREGDVLAGVTKRLAEMKDSAHKPPITILCIEYPTNPDMKDTDLCALRKVVDEYTAATSSTVLMILDSTFSPPSKSAVPFAASAGREALPTIVFTSLSKSVSGGFTTGGSLVANSHPLAQKALAIAHSHLALLDTSSKGCQLKILADMEAKTEERVLAAHKNAVGAAKLLCAAIARHSGHPMSVNFVTDAQIAKGVTPATFSFNLPPPDHLRGNTKVLAGVAQAFVDNLCADWSGVKPCVSFGQQNSIVYATVPATSTQGVISEEDKAKQAVGGIQLVRFSFPPTMDMDEWGKQIDRAAAALYTKPAAKPAATPATSAKPVANVATSQQVQSLEKQIEQLRGAVKNLTATTDSLAARVAAAEAKEQPVQNQPSAAWALGFGAFLGAAVGTAVTYFRKRSN